MSYPVSEKTHVLVGDILDICEIVILYISHDFMAPGMDERPDNPGVPGGRDTRDSARAGPPQHVHQHQLGSVISVVTEGNFGKHFCLCRLRIKAVTGAPTGLFQAAALLLPLPAHVLQRTETGHTQLPGE